MSYASRARLYLCASFFIFSLLLVPNTYFKVSFSIPYYSNGEDERLFEAKIIIIKYLKEQLGLI